MLSTLQDSRQVDPRLEYSRVSLMFLQGYLQKAQRAAERNYVRFLASDPDWAAKFLFLEAEAMVWRGLNQDALRILITLKPTSENELIHERALEGVLFTHLQQFALANAKLSDAQARCETTVLPACGEVTRSQGILAMERGNPGVARRYFLESLSFARSRHDPWLEATALVNLGFVSLQDNRNDEAVDWSLSAHQAALSLGAEDLAQSALGNLGWAYFELGDDERALQLFLDVEKSSEALGDEEFAIKWLTTAAFVAEQNGGPTRAAEAYRHALVLARSIDSKEDIVNSLESLAHVSIEQGQFGEADGYLHQLDPLIRANGNRLDALDVILASGRIAAARRQDQLAEELFRQVEADPASQITMRLGAEHEMARLYEAEGKPEDAQKEYVTALGTFESARAQIKNEDSKLPYFANATPIYDDYIRLLIAQGKSEEALAAADQSRARTLEQGLGGVSALQDVGLHSRALHPESIAGRAGATLLFYWLGEKQSWLWAITVRKSTVFPLPPRREIAAMVERYRQELLGPEDPLRAGNKDGQALYRMLVAPAMELLSPGGKVLVLCDGDLSRLSFETLLVDRESPHYWIEDAEVVSAPSLRMVAMAKPARNPGANLLLVGDAVSPGPDYPELPNAPVEMRQIEKHFRPQDATVFARRQANAADYLRSDPQRFAYIDFVAHGVASRTDPLDSAIILSRMPGGEDSFKLYAREIMQHPIDARLVTIAACYGNGTRSYAGEGLVGLSWAFLRAGAHNVIGALWEVSDASAPRLMDALYQGLQDGLPPSAALRAAKLKLLHGPEEFRRPFYWGSFQLYSVQ